MGDVQSSQAASAPEQDTNAAGKEAQWSPDNLTDSSDEESVAAMKEGHKPAEPEPPPNSIRTPLQQTQSGSISQPSAQSLDSENDGTGLGKDVASSTKNVNGARDSARTSTKKAKRNKFELRQKEVTSPSTASLSEDDRPNGIQSTTRSKSPSHQSAIRTDTASSALNPTNSRFPCPLVNSYDCNQTFASKRSALRHAKLHSSSQKYPCSVCTKAYSRVDVLNVHLKSHSKQELADAHKLTQERQRNRSEDVEQTEQDHEDGLSASESHENLAAISEKENASEENTTTPKDASRSMIQASASSAATSDQPADTDVIEETPRPKSRLKRKRDILQTNLPTPLSIATSRKRRRRHSLSPPTSVASNDSDGTANGYPIDDSEENEISLSNAPSPTRSDPSLTKNEPPNNVMDHSAPNSQSNHSIHNPRSPSVKSAQRIQVVIPRTSQAEPSTRVNKKQKLLPVQSSDHLADDVTPKSGKSRRTVLTIPKGKRRAESGMTYSSPPRHNENGDEDEAFEPEGMATSVAKRGRSEGAVRKKLKPSRQTSKNTRPAKNTEDIPSANDDDEEKFACSECQLEFKTDAKLKKHCRGHQEGEGEEEDAGETGRKGAFKPWEVKKLNDWRDNFCQDNAINIPTFNQMMTDSCRRGKDIIWPYRTIAKDDFLQEYFDLLPGRDRRSMRRYRERQFQNVPVTQEWTLDDDEELMQLVKELGPKWVEIGQRMTRTQDSVSQRWRFKLQYYGSMNLGEWLPAEEENLKEAVFQLKKELRLSLDPLADVPIPWESVSRKLDGSRSAQQCSNKWRLMHQVRKGNKFVKLNSIDRMLGTKKAVATPSKMTQRLSGATSSGRQQRSKSRKRYTSARRVQTSDEESSSDVNETEGEESDEESRSGGSATEDESNVGATQDESDASDKIPSQASSTQVPSPSKYSSRRAISQQSHIEGSTDLETPVGKRNPLSTRTPGTKSLSQAFAQTQANTSALRAPTTTRKAHTQSEMPTPGIPIQKRPTSSSWLAVNRGDVEHAREDEDATMAEPESSDDQMRPIEIKSKGVEAKDSSEASSSESDEEDHENSEADSEEEKEEQSEAETEAKSASSNSSSGSSSGESTGSDAEESGDDGMVHNAQKESFIQSLQSSNNKSSFDSRVLASSGTKRSQSKVDWENVLRGKESIQAESDSDSEDEGDIMHH